jgi:hypothetical protein
MEVQTMKRLLMVSLSVLILSSIAFADDTFPPTWRGADGSIVSEWDSWSGFSSGTISPDTITGVPYVPSGGANAVHSSSTILSANDLGRTNVLLISEWDGIIFNLDNFDTPNPYKFIRVQITYNITDAAAGIPSGFDVWTTGPDVFYPANMVATETKENGWVTSAYDFTLQPNPIEESIGLKFVSKMGETYPFVARIDQVVIDTLCPEPVTLSLLLIGAIGLVSRRH